ncbi:vacuolar protein-sorting-associated protein 25-like [Corticium candelabrum]|uniref:vacuolar protein-sorting-associated protein 25-like n=1 Tax=Corticium candelabrum TaxID=121492 RepID=UPI002E256919|nr:vacuolar protein-sorting-associated protein 25-like [Corticium candelabrum]
MSLKDFEWPWQYDFPPFFTIQPNLDTRQKQIEAWCDLVLAYHRHLKLYTLDLSEAQNSALFSNSKLNRRLPLDGILLVLEMLCERGNVEWEDARKKQRCSVMWRTPEEWAALVYNWASSNGMTNTVCTLYELHSGDDTENEEFHGIELWLLNRALRVMEKQGKAELLAGSSPDGSDSGVKFF